VLEPFAGYWVKNLSEGNVVLEIPPKEAPPVRLLAESTIDAASAGLTDSTPLAVSGVSANATGDASSPTSGEGGGWRLEIRARSCGVVDESNYVGVAEGASSAWDKNDRSEPPMAPERSISLYFPHKNWESHKDDYAVDVRGAYEALVAAELELMRSSEGLGVQAGEDIWVHIWRFDMAKNFMAVGVGDEVTLELAGIENVPAEASAYLIDRDLEKLVDIRTESSYSFHLGEREPVSEAEARFVLIVGSKDFVDERKDELPTPPDRTVLHQNYPNPFNPSTILRYDLARACNVRLAVYDASGALVRVVYEGHRQVGRYEEAWDGRNQNGRRASTGIYFSRLEIDSGFRQTRKLLLVR
jgi:hypothetical protein